MRTFLQPGDHMNYTASGAAKAAGAVVLFGKVVGIVVQDIADGSSGPAMIKGVHLVSKTDSQAWVVGDPIYWDHTNSVFSKTASSDADIAAGVAYEAVASTAGLVTGKILLLPGYGKTAAEVAFSAGTNLVGVDGTGSNAAPLAGTETRLDAIDTAVLAIIASLKAAGLMDD